MPVKLRVRGHYERYLWTCKGRVPASSRLQHHLPLALTERVRERVPVVPREDVTEPRLPTVLVYPLSDLVPRSIPEAGEEREQPRPKRCGRVLTEDDRGERGRVHLSCEVRHVHDPVHSCWLTCLRLVTHQPLRNGIYRMEDQELRDTWRPKQALASSRPFKEPHASIPDVPEPRIRAAPESLPLTFSVGAMAAGGQGARDGVRATVGERQGMRCGRQQTAADAAGRMPPAAK